MGASTIVLFLFWSLAAVTFFGRPKVSLFAYLLLAHIDVSGPFFNSSLSLGFENIVKVVVIPSILLWRVRGSLTWLHRPWPRSSWLWLLLSGYATLAILWSPAPLAAIKMSGYLLSYAILFVIFVDAWSAGLIDAAFIEFNLWAVFCLGMLQTYVLGNEFGSLEELAPRFTTFSSPQALAPCFLVMFAILQDMNIKARHATMSMVIAVTGIVMTGSRYVFFGLILFFVTRIALNAQEGRLRSTMKRIAKVCLVIAALLIVIVKFAPGNRLNELFESSMFGSDRYEQVSTVAWRIGIYSKALDEIADWNLSQFVFGAGTSSAGNLKAAFDPEFGGDILDANRSMHCEFLRAFYEWGLIGFGLMTAFLISLVRDLGGFTRAGKSGAKIAALSFLPTLLCGLAIENILSNSGAPAGTAIVLILSYALANREPLSTSQSDRKITSPKATGSVALAST